MIDHTTLRIGNLVRCDQMAGTPYKDKEVVLPVNIFPVSYITKHFVGLDLGYGAAQKLEPKYIQGVDLTEQWMRWLGFKTTGRGIIKNIFAGHVYLRYQMNYIQLVIHYDLKRTMECHELSNIKHVHHIQNIWLDLTENQLKYEITPDKTQGSKA